MEWLTATSCVCAQGICCQLMASWSKETTWRSMKAHWLVNRTTCASQWTRTPCCCQVCFHLRLLLTNLKDELLFPLTPKVKWLWVKSRWHSGTQWLIGTCGEHVGMWGSALIRRIVICKFDLWSFFFSNYHVNKLNFDYQGHYNWIWKKRKTKSFCSLFCQCLKKYISKKAA